MPRPKKCRRVCCVPRYTSFGPSNPAKDELSIVTMSLDEYETIRLIDYMELNQNECAKQMGIARTTVQSIYVSARKKIAQCLCYGSLLMIDGGDVELYHHDENDNNSCGASCCHHHCNKGISKN